MRIVIFACSAAMLSMLGTAANAEKRCPRPRYAAEIAAASVQAEAQAKALKNLSKSVTKALGSNPSVEVQLRGSYSVSAGGDLAQEAYASTADEIFCYLEQAFSKDPDKLSELIQQKQEFGSLTEEYFDLDLWQVGAGAKRSEIRTQLSSRKARSAPFSGQEKALLAAIPEFNFDRVRTVNFSISAEVAKKASGGVCATLVQASIRQVNPSVLSALQQIRSTLIDWLARNDVQARRTVWRYASAQMNHAAMQSAPPVTITPAVAACVAEAAKVAEKEAEAIAPKPENQEPLKAETPANMDAPPEVKVEEPKSDKSAALGSKINERIDAQ